MCQLSPVTCHMSPIGYIYINLMFILENFKFLNIIIGKLVELVGGGSINNEANPIYFNPINGSKVNAMKNGESQMG